MSLLWPGETSARSMITGPASLCLVPASGCYAEGNDVAPTPTGRLDPWEGTRYKPLSFQQLAFSFYHSQVLHHTILTINKTYYTQKQTAIMASTQLHKIKRVHNPKYKPSGPKSYVYLLRKYNFCPTMEGPYYMGSKVRDSKQKWSFSALLRVPWRKVLHLNPRLVLGDPQRLTTLFD